MRLVGIFAVCLTALSSSVFSLGEADEDLLRLAWAVKRLVGNTCNSSSSSFLAPAARYQGRQGKIGPVGPPGSRGSPGPKGEQGYCICDQEDTESRRSKIQLLESRLLEMEAKLPEEFCLLGMKSGKIPDSAITVSTMNAAAYCQIGNARLDHHGAWCATANRVGSDWIEVDLGNIERVTGVVTQGQGNYPGTNEWVTSFRVEYGTTAGSRQAITENYKAKVFASVNFNKNTKVVTRFPNPVQARYIRIVPLSFSGHMSMRFDVINC